jgi:hypothetical protein
MVSFPSSVDLFLIDSQIRNPKVSVEAWQKGREGIPSCTGIEAKRVGDELTRHDIW